MTTRPTVSLRGVFLYIFLYIISFLVLCKALQKGSGKGKPQGDKHLLAVQGNGSEHGLKGRKIDSAEYCRCRAQHRKYKLGVIEVGHGEDVLCLGFALENVEKLRHYQRQQRSSSGGSQTCACAEHYREAGKGAYADEYAPENYAEHKSA